MTVKEFLKNDKFLGFVGGVLAATYGVRALKSDKARELCVNGLAKCMKLSDGAKETYKNMKEEAQDICYDAKKLSNGEAED